MVLNKLRNKLINTSRFNKQLLVATNDFLLLILATLLALSINQGTLFFFNTEQLFRLIWAPLFGVTFLALLGIYRSILRFIEFSILYKLTWSLGLIFIVNFVITEYLGDYLRLILPFLPPSEIKLSLEAWVIGFLSSVVLIIGSRVVAVRFFSEQVAEKRVIIYGAGSAGIQLSGALNVSLEMKPIAFVDDNKSLQGTYLGGIKVIKPKRLRGFIKKENIDEVLIAMPSLSKASLRSILREVEEYSVKVRILPGVAELAQGKVSVSELKEVEVEDLLGRLEVDANPDLINKHTKGKVVMVTGAGGSIGSEIARQVLKNNCELLILFDINEFSLYSIKQELQEQESGVKVESILGNIIDKKRVRQVCKTFGVQTIYHAAAYKHVPLVEENPFEAVTNNIFGTLNCSLAAIESEVETFVFISTDKAVRPTNVMGATKRFAELILQSLAQKYEESRKTKISMVRFGNVLGSSGSAIPLFQKQIREGGPLTVTDPEVIRYFMSIPEAAELVIQAGAMGEGGDLFVLDMGEPVRILELAERLIKLSGMEIKSESNPDGDIEIVFTGLRPGEKLYEELLIGDNVGSTEHKQIFRANEDFFLWKDLKDSINLIEEAKDSSDYSKLREIFTRTVTGYKPEQEIADTIYLKKQSSSLKS